jgi:hypothetical protein
VQAGDSWLWLDTAQQVGGLTCAVPLPESCHRPGKLAVAWPCCDRAEHKQFDSTTT